jgi:hypothetical protein
MTMMTAVAAVAIQTTTTTIPRAKNIVLNDDDCPAACVEDVVHPERLDNNQEERIDQEQQFVSSDAQHCGQSSKNCVRGGYGSQFFRSKVRILLLFLFQLYAFNYWNGSSRV